VARTTKWARKPIDAEEIRALGDRLSFIARSFVSDGLEIDVPLITRAVRYLSQAHAIPPMGDDTQWFSNMLTVVLEIARPNSAVDKTGKAFLRDMIHGITTALMALQLL
jgi:hypothetical protein